MKKVFTLLGSLFIVSYANAIDWPDLSVRSNVGFDSEFEYRGRKQGQQIFRPQVEVGLPLFDRGEFYVGMNAFVGTSGSGNPAPDVEDAISTTYTPSDGENKGKAGQELSLTAVPFKEKPEAKEGEDEENTTVASVEDGSNHTVKTMNQVDIYAGVRWPVDDTFSVDVGYIHHFYTNLRGKVAGVLGKVDVPELGTAVVPAKGLVNDGKYVSYDLEPIFFKRTNTNEVYVGVTADVLLKPSLYCAYDFNREELNFEGMIGHTVDLGEYGFSGFSIDLSAKLGYDTARRPFGIPWSEWKNDTEETTNNYVVYNEATKSLTKGTDDKGVELDENVAGETLNGGKKNYIYWGLGSDLVYAFNDNAKVRAGVRYTGNDASKESWVNCIGRNEDGKGHKNLLWFTTSFDFSF
jgi:hypothetical protein